MLNVPSASDTASAAVDVESVCDVIFMVAYCSPSFVVASATTPFTTKRFAVWALASVAKEKSGATSVAVNRYWLLKKVIIHYYYLVHKYVKNAEDFRRSAYLRIQS